MYVGQPARATRCLTAERLPDAFRNLTFTVMKLPTQVIRQLTPLTPLHHRLLTLTGINATCYTQLVVDVSTSSYELSER